MTVRSCELSETEQVVWILHIFFLVVFGCYIAVPNNVALGEKIKRTPDESVTVKGDSNATVAIFNNTVVFLHVGLLKCLIRNLGLKSSKQNVVPWRFQRSS